MFQSTATAYMVTAIVEGGLLLFSFKFHHISKWYALLWTGFLIYSIIASRGSIVDEINVKQQNKKVESLDYKQYTTDTTSIDSQITTLQNRLNNLNSSNPVDSLNAINDINNKLASKRSELSGIPVTSKTQRKRNDIQNEIESLENSKKELLKISSTLQQNEAEKQTETKSIYTQLDKLNADKKSLTSKSEGIGNKNAFKESILDTGLTEVRFWTIFFIFLEITRFVLQTKDKKSLISVFDSFRDKTSGLFQKIKSQSNVKTIAAKFKNEEKPKNKIGFQSQSDSSTPPAISGISNTDWNNYIVTMFNTAKGNVSKGYRAIASEIGVTDEQARKIKGALEQIDGVRTTGARTIIVKSQSELLR
jgi:hypothetical protein